MATGLKPVIDDRDHVRRSTRVFLQPKDVTGATAIRAGCLGQLGSREQALLLADGDEPDLQTCRDRRPEQEAARFDTSDLGDVLRERFGERVENAPEELGVVEQRPDVRVTVRKRDPPA
ncbi:MAG TPA: hypothetical protein VGG41_14390 [Solirubrobacteraceae bacterium]